ncbi:hypothetical protein G3O08_17890 [Cryomorpha ignava]|uniref:Uncharacterized protein n=1 Tax=Cryomorpha ignava TaxID=101383 RepID=A0A7K3WWE7_9FLAO|nr:hypothetical protein [Cryomorpha ignava]NEN25371.1 hypothetical protein [Cryomorpha ignava]
MGTTNKKPSESSEKSSIEEKVEVADINERPRICCIDVDQKVVEQLKHLKFNVFSGTLGSKVKVPNSSRGVNHHLLLNFNFPKNLHEYDIIILDLANFETVDYNAEMHIRNDHTGRSALSLLSRYPETIFDPRPLGSSILGKKLKEIGSRGHIIIAFTSVSYDLEYESVKTSDGYPESQGLMKKNIYDFLGNVPLSLSKYGKEMTPYDIREDLKNLLNSYLLNSTYNQTFNHPTKWQNDKQIPDPNFFPLIKNSSGDIVSISEFRGNSYIFYFPQISQKEKFIESFLTKIAPDIMPDIFPDSTTFSWKSKEEYWLPHYKKLLREKRHIEKEYEKNIKLKDAEISKNAKEYSFLHEIITETGDILVKALIKYFKWLGFKKVTNVDERNPNSSVLEEDIQVELNDGILIIECKGIGGTSTDSDCSQIAKIKHRRCKERNRFDVYALYIVNHQRYLPPTSRQNPPFSENQKQDAINDERGLISTWQLFNLYFEIESGILAKEDVRNNLTRFGYLEFRPSNLVFIDEPKEHLKNGKVCIINISDVELKIAEEILVEKNGKFTKTTIQGIQINDKPISSTKTGEFGLQLSNPIKQKSILWKKAIS